MNNKARRLNCYVSAWKQKMQQLCTDFVMYWININTIHVNKNVNIVIYEVQRKESALYVYLFLFGKNSVSEIDYTEHINTCRYIRSFQFPPQLLSILTVSNWSFSCLPLIERFQRMNGYCNFIGDWCTRWKREVGRPVMDASFPLDWMGKRVLICWRRWLDLWSSGELIDFPGKFISWKVY